MLNYGTGHHNIYICGLGLEFYFEKRYMLTPLDNNPYFFLKFLKCCQYIIIRLCVLKLNSYAFLKKGMFCVLTESVATVLLIFSLDLSMKIRIFFAPFTLRVFCKASSMTQWMVCLLVGPQLNYLHKYLMNNHKILYRQKHAHCTLCLVPIVKC